MKSVLTILENLDRRFIYLIVGLGTLIPMLHPLHLPVSVTPPVQKIFDYIETLSPSDAVIVSFDYGPGSEPENDPQAEAVIRHIFEKKIKLIVIALYPLGGVTMAQVSLNKVASEYPDLVYGTDYINLGYKDGGIAVLKAMGHDIHKVFPSDIEKRPVEQFPLMKRIHSYADIKLAVSLATGIIGEWWANLVNTQYGLPIVVGCTAVSAPKYYAYLKSGNMLGMMGGLKAASEYEKLIIDAYPNTQKAYNVVGAYSAIKGMDVQSVVHLIIIGFIVLGNVAYFRSKSKPLA